MARTVLKFGGTSVADLDRIANVADIVADRAAKGEHMAVVVSAMSGETNKLIDAEIRSLVEGAHKRATQILTDKEDQLHLLAQTMLEFETLTGDEIDQLLKDGKLDRPDEPSGPAKPRSVSGSAVPKAGKRFDVLLNATTRRDATFARPGQAPSGRRSQEAWGWWMRWSGPPQTPRASTN